MIYEGDDKIRNMLLKRRIRFEL